MSDKPRDLYIWWGNDIEVFTEEEFQQHKTQDYYRPEDITHVREVIEPSPSQDEQAKANTKQLIEDLTKHDLTEPFYIKNQVYSTEHTTPGEPVVIEGYSTSQDEFDEKAARLADPVISGDYENTDPGFVGGAKWQFNQMKPMKRAYFHSRMGLPDEETGK